MRLVTLLLEPKLRGVDLQGYDRIALHAEILAKKSLIREVFNDFYAISAEMDRRYFGNVIGAKIELGAGTSLFKAQYPEVISTDLQSAPHLDAIIDAQAMPLENESVRVFFCINCFHHFPHPDKFLAEVLRTVRPGGGCVIIEPYFGFVAALLYRRLFTSEAYDRSACDWTYCKDTVTEGCRPNQALSYLTFFRDRDKFEALFPSLEIVHTAVLQNYIRYLLSGGLNFKQLVPSFLEPALRPLENLLSPLASIFGLHHIVVIRKRKSFSPLSQPSFTLRDPD